MEKRMFAEKAPRDKVYRALAVFALLPSCFLAGCAGEKGVDAGSSSPAPYGSSETTTSQPENSNTENSSQNKKDDSAGKIDIELIDNAVERILSMKYAYGIISD